MTLNDEIFFFKPETSSSTVFRQKSKFCAELSLSAFFGSLGEKNGGMPICRNGKLSNMWNIMEQNKATPSADSYFLCVLIHEWAAVVRVRQEILQLK